MPALTLVNGEVQHEVTALDIAPASGVIKKRLLIQWNGSGQAHYVLNLDTNTLHKVTNSVRLGALAGRWKAQDLTLAKVYWIEFYRRKNGRE